MATTGVPPGYDPGQSLLAGGSGHLEAMRGGGKNAIDLEVVPGKEHESRPSVAEVAAGDAAEKPVAEVAAGNAAGDAAEKPVAGDAAEKPVAEVAAEKPVAEVAAGNAAEVAVGDATGTLLDNIPLPLKAQLEAAFDFKIDDTERGKQAKLFELIAKMIQTRKGASIAGNIIIEIPIASSVKHATEPVVAADAGVKRTGGSRLPKTPRRKKSLRKSQTRRSQK